MLADRLHAPAGTRLRCHIEVHVSGAPARVRWGVHVEAISIRWGGVVQPVATLPRGVAAAVPRVGRAGDVLDRGSVEKLACSLAL